MSAQMRPMRRSVNIWPAISAVAAAMGRSSLQSAKPSPNSEAKRRRTMPIKDLREWIERVEEMGELTRVDGADANIELGSLVDLYQWDMGNPALLFDNIVGYQPGFRVLANVLTSLPRIALSLGLPVEYTARQFVEVWRTQLKDLKLLPPTLVPNGPIFENRMHGSKVDLTKIPAPVWHEGDGGRFIGTGCIVVTR